MTDIKKEKFDKYILLLNKWQKSINLVSKNTLPEVWERHFEDSLYLYEYIKDKTDIIDIGSGAGFPGMVMAVAGIKNITLVEADERKCLFLKEIKREYNLDTEIKNERVENLNRNYKCITGRAFAPLDKFLELCEKIIDTKTEMFLLKGNNIEEEIKSTEKKWNFDYTLYKKPAGFIIKIYNISKK